MNKALAISLSLAAATIVAIVAANIVAGAKPDTEGAQPGVWTQDYDAALAAAKKDGLPLMINFTGSDWCGWCKLMDRQVFSTEEWRTWAKDKIYLAFIDFPKKDSLVPKQYRKRNDELAGKYRVSGFPTYIVVDPATGGQIGKLGASPDASPERFIAKLGQLIVLGNDSLLRSALSAEDYESLQRLMNERGELEDEMEKFAMGAGDKVKALMKAVEDAGDDKAMRDEAQQRFKDKVEELDAEYRMLSKRHDELDEKIAEISKKAEPKAKAEK